ncbi:MAG: hypothetical protein AAF740_05445, partial [Bacteroidota bacterium]
NKATYLQGVSPNEDIIILEFDNDIMRKYSYHELGEMKRLIEFHKPLDENFIAAIPGLIQDLSFFLDIPISELDRSLESLNKIDSTITKLYEAHEMDIDRKKLMLPLIAYVGEVIISEKNRTWEVIIEENNEKSIYIKGQDGHVYDFYPKLSYECQELRFVPFVNAVVPWVLSPKKLPTSYDRPNWDRG